MNEANFTKGPWVVGVRNCNEIMTSFPGVFIGGVFLDVPTKNDSHDANLIAAAPELYDALEDLLEKLDMTPELNLDSWGVYTFEAEAALAKARGEHE